jgi:hypothetical protein
MQRLRAPAQAAAPTCGETVPQICGMDRGAGIC